MTHRKLKKEGSKQICTFYFFRLHVYQSPHRKRSAANKLSRGLRSSISATKLKAAASHHEDTCLLTHNNLIYY